MADINGTGKRGFLDRALTTIEWLGNKLPDPIFLFIGATVLVMALSALGSAMEWTVQPVKPQVVTETVDGVARAVRNEDGKPMLELVPTGTPIGPRSLLTGEGVYWLISNMVRNFINFAPLGVVLVCMLGIGVAEKVGMFVALMRYLAGIVPSAALTPMMVFLGVMSHVASDAGYIILPPLAGALYAAVGRPPLAGIAAAFAGVAGGFSANLLISSTDALVAPLTERGARMLDANYSVLVTCNWFFLAASAFLLTLAGWVVTAKLVEPRLKAQAEARAAAVASAGAEAEVESQQLGAPEKRGLRAAAIAAVVTLAGLASLMFAPGAPLSGTMPAPAPAFGPIPVRPAATEGTFTKAGDAPEGQRSIPGSFAVKPGTTLEAEGPEGQRGTFRVKSGDELTGTFDQGPAAQPRWSQAIVPFILIAFVVPAIAYGITTGAIKKHSDITKGFVHAMTSMAPVIAMAFFAAQFIECFRYSQLDAMIANAGGKALAAAALPAPVMLVALVLLIVVVDLLIASMSAKWTALAPILVPMMMMAGISPELTQAAYRVGDSVANIVTPLNSYIIVILAAVQRYRKDAGIGNLIAIMLPYSVSFFVVWTGFLLLWVALDIPLGPGAPLWYTPGQ
ncbi:MAG TPA: AbgT family transporter [Phycisphaerales bacterium]|nr:AbgT family transporter [Phycisphaerales bacterium]